MVQLELDPRHMQPEHFAEIEAAQSTILRRRIAGGTRYGEREKRYRDISFDEALSNLLEMAYGKFRNSTDTAGYQRDLLVGRALKRALPFLYGEKGNFDSFGYFRDVMFVKRMLPQVAIDYHRHKLTIPRQDTQRRNSPSKEVKRVSREGFQPTLFRLNEETTGGEQALEQLLVKLKNPSLILGSNNPIKAARRQRAWELKLENPNYFSHDIARVLEDEGFGNVSPTAVRVWSFRDRKDAGRQRHLARLSVDERKARGIDRQASTTLHPNVRMTGGRDVEISSACVNGSPAETSKVAREAPGVVLVREIRAAQSDAEKQAALDRVRRSFYERHHKALFVAVSALASLDFRQPTRNIRHFREALRQAGVPMGEFPFVVRSGPRPRIFTESFLDVRDQERAREVLLNAPTLVGYLRNSPSESAGEQAVGF